MYNKLSISPLKTFLVTIIAVFVTELIVVLVLHLSPSLSIKTESLIDAALLTIVVSLLFYLLVVRSWLRHVTDQKEYQEEQAKLMQAYQEQYQLAADASAELENALSLAKRAEHLLQEKNEHLEVANSTKNEFLARMSHEIRTPIHSTMGMLELALGTELNEEQADYLITAMTSAESLLSIINSVLDFSKINAGHLELNVEDFSLQSALDRITDMIAPQAQKKGLELVCYRPEAVPTALKGDEARLCQILINLMYNSVKFTEEGEILVRIEVQSENEAEVELRFSVSDTGIGIPEDKQARIFDAFVQADGSDTRLYGGTGLGLTVSKQLVELMGGLIWLESSPGAGTTFSFDIAFPKQGTQENPAALVPPAEWNGLRALIVDDNEASRLVLKEMLGNWGFQVTEARNAPEGITQLYSAKSEGCPFHLIMIDSVMPIVDGFTLSRQIESSGEHEETVIMMLLSDKTGGDAARIRELGIENCLPKPVKQSVLYNRLKAALGAFEEDTDKAGHPATVPSPVKNITILVADDNATAQVIARKNLTKRGYTVFTAGNGYEVLKLVNDIHIDLVLMDVEMPQMNGLEATRIIRGQEEGSGFRLPIIAMTAYAQNEDKQRCLDAGMDDYISKPVKYEVIAREIDARLAGTHIADETPVPEQEPAAEPVMDMTYALDMVEGDKELLSEALELFVQDDYPRQLEAIKDCLDNKDASGVSSAAHGIKGAAASLGGKSLSELAKQLEAAGKEQDLATAGKTLTYLEEEFEKLLDELHQTGLINPDN